MTPSVSSNAGSFAREESTCTWGKRLMASSLMVDVEGWLKILLKCSADLFIILSPCIINVVLSAHWLSALNKGELSDDSGPYIALIN